MATPDFDHRSNEVEWKIQKDYTYQENDSTFRCALTGRPKRPGEVVYVGAYIDEFIGYHAIGQDAAEQLARLIGWIDPDTLVMTPDEELELRVAELEAENAKLQETLERMRATLVDSAL